MRRLLSLATISLLSACGSADAAQDAAEPQAVLASATGEQALPTILVYKTPSCSCCNGWVEHLRAAGFTVEAENRRDMERIKTENGIPTELRSCHTGFVGGYFVEGHVPAADLKRLLKERPKLAGLSVPNMPIGSPGMEGPNASPYQVLSFDHQGRAAVFAEIDPR